MKFKRRLTLIDSLSNILCTAIIVAVLVGGAVPFIGGFYSASSSIGEIDGYSLHPEQGMLKARQEIVLELKRQNDLNERSLEKSFEPAYK